MPGKVKKYRPAPFVPTTSFTGSEDPLLLRAENMWLRFSRFGSLYAEGYTGNLDLNETIDTETLAGNIRWSSTSLSVSGSGTSFLSKLRVGQYVLGVDGSNSELFVVESVVSDTSFTVARYPSTTVGAYTGVGYIMPVIFPVGFNRGTAIAGNVLKYPKGHYLGVGQGTFKVNGSALSSSSLVLSKTPQLALYSGASYTTVKNVGLPIPSVPTLSYEVPSGGYRTIASSTNATPIEVTISGTDHFLFTGDIVTIKDHTLNTNANGTYKIKRVSATKFTLHNVDTGADIAGNGVGGATGTITAKTSQMLHSTSALYSVRICAGSTQTLGFSNPTPAIDPQTISASGNWLKITFNEAMPDNVDCYDIYCSQQADTLSPVSAQYMGPWYKVARVTDEMLKNTGTSTSTGRESGTFFIFCFSDAEISASNRILTFTNFPPEQAEFVDMMNGIPIYFSCLGPRDTTSKSGKSPGPVAIPSKPSNPEAVFLDKAITTAGGETIVGEFNAKGRIFVLCENSLQALILTTLEEEPIAFRSLWSCGFKNPYNVCFVKDYLYGFSNHRFVRGVAGGDESYMEFDYASDVYEYTSDWKTGYMMTQYDPKNRAVCHFYCAAEKRSGYWVTIVLPFMIDKQIWNPPIILKKANQDFIVSGVCTIGQQLVFLAGGRKSSGAVEVKTYVFDGGDSDTKDWYMAWNYADDGVEMNPKTLRGFSLTGRFASASSVFSVFGVKNAGTFSLSDLASNTSPQTQYIFGSSSGNIKRFRQMRLDSGPHNLYSVRIGGSYTTVADRLDELAVQVVVNNSEM